MITVSKNNVQNYTQKLYLPAIIGGFRSARLLKSVSLCVNVCVNVCVNLFSVTTMVLIRLRH